MSKLPAVTFTIGGASLDLQPQQWTRPVRALCLSGHSPISRCSRETNP